MGVKEGIGTVGGGTVGALMGSQFGSGNGKLAAVAAGALLGGLFGGQMGRLLDEQDKKMAQNAATDALERQPDGVPVNWQNPNNSHRGNFCVEKTAYEGGRPCRQYTQEVWIDGVKQLAHGKACRDSNGQWCIV
jgi:surface antigen